MAVAAPPVARPVTALAGTLPSGATQGIPGISGAPNRLVRHWRKVPSSVEKGTFCNPSSVKTFQPKEPRRSMPE